MNNCLAKETIHQPGRDCAGCPRLVAFREENQKHHSSFYNGAVPAFGGLDARLLVVGLAPGLKGANASGRPFTGDYAGEVLYPALLKAGLAKGVYGAVASDGLELVHTRISNAVRCVPPENKPETSEIKQCNSFLKSEIAAMPNVRVILSLGGISHKSVLMALGLKQSAFAFAHAAEHRISHAGRELVLLNSYHTSRYNINVGTLTFAMFDGIMVRAKELAAC